MGGDLSRPEAADEGDAPPPDLDATAPKSQMAMSRSASAQALPPMAAEQRHSRAATWQHRGQQRRVYTRAPWGPRSNANTLSDSESEASFSEASGPLSAGSHSSRVKRTFSEASDCSELGQEETYHQGRSGHSSGTWPRLSKRSSRTSLSTHDTLDVWQMTTALAREKTDLADQLARMTSEMGVQGHGHDAAHGHSDPSSAWDEMSSDPRMAELDNLVEAEMVAEQRAGQAAEVDDGTVDAILGALQSQFKPDDPEDEPKPPAPSPPRQPMPHSNEYPYMSMHDSPLDSMYAPPPQQHYHHHHHQQQQQQQQQQQRRRPQQGGGVPSHPPPYHHHLPQHPGYYPHHHHQQHYQQHHQQHPGYPEGPPPHGYPPSHADRHCGGGGGGSSSSSSSGSSVEYGAAPPSMHPGHHHHLAAHHLPTAPPPSHPPPHAPLGHGGRRAAAKASDGPAEPVSGGHHLSHGGPADGYKTEPWAEQQYSHYGGGEPPRAPRGHAQGAPPAQQQGETPGAEGMEGMGGGWKQRPMADLAPLPVGNQPLVEADDSPLSNASPLMLSAEQLCMYEGLFDDVDFVGEVDAASKSTILSSDAIEKVLNSSSLNSTLSPVLEATPGAEIASEMGDVFTLPLTPDIDHERRHTAADSPPPAAAPTHAPVNVQAPAPAEPPASLVLPPPLGGGGRLGSRKELPPLPDANPLAGLPPLSQTHDGGPPPPGPAPMSAQALQSLGDTLVNALTGVINNDDHDMGSGVLSGGQGAPPPLGGGGALPPVDFPMEKESGPNRKEWAAGEDELILEAVKSLGCKWRQIASMLPGRSDDAVRNRWNRLKEPSSLVRAMPDASGTSGSSAYRCSKCGRLKKNHRCTYVPPDDKDKDKGDKGSRGDGGDGWGLDHDDEGGGGAEGHKEGKRKQERMGWTKVRALHTSPARVTWQPSC